MENVTRRTEREERASRVEIGEDSTFVARQPRRYASKYKRDHVGIRLNPAALSASLRRRRFTRERFNFDLDVILSFKRMINTPVLYVEAFAGVCYSPFLFSSPPLPPFPFLPSRGRGRTNLLGDVNSASRNAIFVFSEIIYLKQRRLSSGHFDEYPRKI